MATEKYLGGTDDPVKKKDLFMDLLGDAIFVFTAVAVARPNRGESQRLDQKGHQPHHLSCSFPAPRPQTRTCKLRKVGPSRLVPSGLGAGTILVQTPRKGPRFNRRVCKGPRNHQWRSGEVTWGEGLSGRTGKRAPTVDPWSRALWGPAEDGSQGCPGGQRPESSVQGCSQEGVSSLEL